MTKQGYIMLHRSIQQHWLYDEKRKFSKYEAWLDLLMMVNYKDNKILQDGVLVEVKRGERITSIRQLMDRWGWSNTKVVNFLELLKNDEMIIFEITPKKKTLIKIVKYEQYQGFDDSDQSPKQTQERQGTDTETTQNNINNKDNKENKVNKEDIKDIIPFSEIIDYLNLKAGTKYKASGKKTQSLISARWNEKFILDDFKTVIDKKTAQWLGTDSALYLRPETLFGTKFESYLNQLGGGNSEPHAGNFKQTQRTGGRQYSIEPPPIDWKQR